MGMNKRFVFSNKLVQVSVDFTFGQTSHFHLKITRFEDLHTKSEKTIQSTSQMQI